VVISSKVTTLHVCMKCLVCEDDMLLYVLGYTWSIVGVCHARGAVGHYVKDLTYPRQDLSQLHSSPTKVHTNKDRVYVCTMISMCVCSVGPNVPENQFSV